VSSFLKLPQSVEEEGSRIYTLAVRKGLVRGRSMESVVAGALYAACRRHDVPRNWMNYQKLPHRKERNR